MASDENKKNRIMDYSFHKFTTMGIQHVTMDEISKGLGIGKGTLYKFFPSKEALLYETINFTGARIEKTIKEIMTDEARNPVEKLEQVFKTIGEKISKVNPSVLSYMERSMPEAFEKIEEVRRRIIMNNIRKLFEDGKKSGHFRPDMDAYLVAHILIGAANHVSETKVLTTLDYSLENLFSTVVATILNGCLTEEGRRTILKK